MLRRTIRYTPCSFCCVFVFFFLIRIELGLGGGPRTGFEGVVCNYFKSFLYLIFF
jgi:hypothetical protein